jgi:nucleotide-binding universal stress UspA family protein
VRAATDRGAALAPPSGMKTYLVPTDFSKESRVAMAFAVRLAAEEHARVVLLHVYSFPIAPDVMLSATTIEDMQRSIDGALADWKAQAQALAPNIVVETESKLGPTADQILAWEQVERPYAIVMGTHGRGRVASALLGSVAQRLLHSARCPVIVVRPEKS